MSEQGQRVAIITGGSQGIGAGLVAAYRRQGWAVVATFRTIRPAGDPAVLTVDGDVSEPATTGRRDGKASPDHKAGPGRAGTDLGKAGAMRWMAAITAPAGRAGAGANAGPRGPQPPHQPLWPPGGARSAALTASRDRTGVPARPA
jgi:NAD(P)-dependent dehydrogenase (short-subunit alcohol dehydrogenase family)